MSTKLQVPSVYRELTVAQNLRIAVQRQAGEQARAALIEETLELIGLADKADQKATFLSHGHQQWLEIGMAIASRPRLLLLDEPTAGMTPDETRQTVRIVSRLNKERGMSVVIVEHDTGFVADLRRALIVNRRRRTGAPLTNLARPPGRAAVANAIVADPGGGERGVRAPSLP